MHKKTKFRIMLFFTILLISLLSFPATSGDGGVFIPTVDLWINAPEENQIGIIDYEDGVENLIIVVDVKNSSLQSDKAVWIFPVPSNPEEVTIDILKDIPFLRGESIDNLANDNLENTFLLMLLSQTYLAPLAIFWYGSAMIGSSDQDIIIYDQVQKMGLTTEVISVKNSESFSSYLNEKDVNFSDEVFAIMDEYIGENYSFVVSWISDIEQFREEALIENDYYYYGYYGEPFFMLGVSITFPTDKIYYPLKLTSIYDEKLIPILLQIHGYVTTDFDIDYTYTDYLIDGDTHYTEITINSKAKNLKEDLWIKNKHSSEINLISFIANNGVTFTILLFISASCLSSLLAGIIIYYEQKPIFYKFILLGLCNFFTLIGLIVTAYILKISQNFVKENSEGKINIKRKYTTPLKTIISIAISILIILFLSSYFNPGSENQLFFIILIFGSIIGVIPLISYWLAKDKKRTAFIILFSMFYLTFTFGFYFYFDSIL